MTRQRGLSLEIRRLRDLIRSFFADSLTNEEIDAAGEHRLDEIALRRKPVDAATVVAEVASRKDGERVTILVRIEPEAPIPRGSCLGISQSLRALRLPYGEPVLPSVIYLQGGRPGLHLESGVLAQAAGIEMARIYFTIFGLSDARAEYFLERPEPLAWALAARMRPTMRSLDEHHRACLKRIATAPLDEERRALLRRGARVFLDAQQLLDAQHSPPQ